MLLVAMEEGDSVGASFFVDRENHRFHIPGFAVDTESLPALSRTNTGHPDADEVLLSSTMAAFYLHYIILHVSPLDGVQALSVRVQTQLLDLHGAEYNALVQEHSYSSTL